MGTGDRAARQQDTPRKSGIEVVGDVPWGTHFCQFYQTSEDLVEIVIPYIGEGLAANEFCMWVTSGPLSVEQAEAALRAAVPSLDEYAARGQIEILDYRQWYIKNGKFEPDRMLQNWVDKVGEALKKGFAGLRLCGDTFWLRHADWDGFARYEETVNSVIGRYRMLALCTYSPEMCRATEIMDVVANHRFALIKRAGNWEVFACVECKKAGQSLCESEEKFQIVAENTYDFEFWLDPESKYIYASPSCERITGHKPEEFLADPSLRSRIVHPDDRPRLLEHSKEEKENRVAAEIEHRIVRPDGSERWVHHVCLPVFDRGGKFLGTRGSNRDITERKRAEEAVAQARDEWERTFNTVPDLVAILDREHRILRVNRAMADRLGVTPEQAVGLHCYKAVHGTPEPPDFCPHSLTSQDGKEHVAEVHEPRLGGDFLVSTTPMCDAQGRLIGSIHVARDITQHKRAEAQLSYLASFPTLNPLPVVELDSSGAVSYANPAAEHLFPTLGPAHPFLAGLDSLLPGLREGAPQTFSREVTADGRDYLESLFYVQDTGKVRIYGLDITERKQAEEALHKEKAISDTTIESLPGIFYLFDSEGRFLKWNKNFERVSGYTAEELSTMHPSSFFVGDDLQLVEQRVREVFTRGESWAEAEFVSKDGHKTPYFFTGLLTTIGNVNCLIGMGIDITERRKIEAALREARDGLEKRVHERTAELTRINEILEAQIAERKRAEEGARTERQRLYDVLETLPVYVVLLSEDYHVPFANRFFRERFGESHGKRCFEYLFGRTEPCEICESYTALKTNGPHRWEWTGPDGRNYDIYDFPFTDSDGARMILEMGIDITEVKRAQEALKRKEEGLAEAQRIAHLGNWDWNIVTNGLSWSDEVYRIFGLEPQEFGATYDAFLESVHLEDRQSLNEAVNRSLADPNVHYSIEHRVIWPDGTQRVVHERGEVTFDEKGKPIRMIGTVHDITERKQAEEALRRSKDFLQTVIDGIPDPTMVIGTDYRVLLANRGAQTLAGGDPVQEGRRCFQVLHHREAPCAETADYCPLEIVIRTRKPALVMHKHYNENGDEIVVEANAAPILDASGEVIQIVKSCRDVSERLRTEEEMRRLREELAHVARVTTMGELAASLAHELNQPLTAISSNASAAQRFIDRTPPNLDEVREALEDIVKDGHRAGGVIRRLRALLKKGELERTPLDINGIVEEIVSLLYSEAVVKGVNMRMDLQRELPLVLGDRIQIQQVLMNLMMNGMESMAEVGAESRKLVVTTSPHDGNAVLVSIQDAGLGLDEENMAKLFTPFFTTKAEGMGMGLAIARSIVEAHGGRLWATNNPDRGATFHFTLPVS
ncbi:MAG: PAS domain S-box protein [bacterium]|nr:PAS domain S-box protein [bacterium]